MIRVIRTKQKSTAGRTPAPRRRRERRSPRGERRSDAAWETSRARFALSREAFREAVAQRQKKNDETSHEHQTTTNAEDAMDKSAASYSVQTPGGTTSETTSEQKNKHVPAERRGRRGGRSGAGGGRRRRGGSLCPGTRTRTRTGRPARATSTSGCFARASFPRSRHVVTFVVVRARYSYRRAAETCSRKPSKLSKNFERVDCWVIVRRRLCRAPPVGRHASRDARRGAPRGVFVARDVDSARHERRWRRERNLWTGDGRPRDDRGANR